MSSNAWRALVSALADDRAREVYARIVLGQPVQPALEALSPGKQRRVLDTLTRAGLIVADQDGWRSAPEVFRDALAAAPEATRPTGVERFFSDGRLTVYPARAADRELVLAYIGERVLEPDETVTENAINERLGMVTGDVAAMRRYLVDAGVLERTADGAAYSRAR